MTRMFLGLSVAFVFISTSRAETVDVKYHKPVDLNSYYPVFAILALGVLLVHFEKEIYFGGTIALVLAIIALALRRVAARGRRR